VSEDAIEAILAAHTPEVRALADALRSLVRDALPADAREVAYPGWHGIGFRDRRAGYVGAVFPVEDRVRLGFERGVELDDPEGLLAGEGRQVRYVELRPGDRVPEDAIRALVHQALALGPRRG
jgi:hypothetical protein